MAQGMPSMIALLGLLAVAGYKNRDKIAEAFRRGGKRRAANQADRIYRIKVVYSISWGGSSAVRVPEAY